jgi:DeoR/GlpR family transcriptional regulator of sugar metabolism
VIATHNKIGVISNYSIGRTDEIHGIITDREGAEFFRSDSNITAEIIEA